MTAMMTKTARASGGNDDRLILDGVRRMVSRYNNTTIKVPII